MGFSLNFMNRDNSGQNSNSPYPFKVPRLAMGFSLNFMNRDNSGQNSTSPATRSRCRVSDGLQFELYES